VSHSPPIPPCPPWGDKASAEPLPAGPLGEWREGAASHGVRELPAPPKIVAPPPLPPSANAAEPAPDEAEGWWSSEGRLESSAWLTSFLIHFVALFVLGLITFSAHGGGKGMSLLASAGEADPAPGDLDQQPMVVEPESRQIDTAKDMPLEAEPVDLPAETPRIVLPAEDPTKISVDRPDAVGAAAQGTGAAGRSGAPTGGGWEGRNPAARSEMAARGGGTKDSEAAVERGLQWLVAHQRQDGSWSFDLDKEPCNGMCRNSGSEPSTTAATGMALLPFLGAGYTHLKGEHKEVVRKGVYYLKTRARVTPHGVDLCDGGTMYAHGIAGLALCEAYGMTRDEALKDIAQGAIRYVAYAQDLRGGGWRYFPGMPGDTTVTGWQLMLLKSGQMAGLEVPSPTISRVERFLNAVQFDRGARYGYTQPRMRAQTQEATTAVGLLCRMYTGWHRDRPALYRGVAHLHKWGPSENNIYYDFYATQVLHHWEGPEWQAWNKKMRDYLVATQATASHENGSWHFAGALGDLVGGRLYNTSMALMILEVYYRHMPLYGQKAVRDQF
jgi:hypothetical protein